MYITRRLYYEKIIFNYRMRIVVYIAFNNSNEQNPKYRKQSERVHRNRTRAQRKIKIKEGLHMNEIRNQLLLILQAEKEADKKDHDLKIE